MGEHSRNHVASHVHCHRSPCHRCRCLQLLLILWLLRALRRTLLWPRRPCCRYCYWHCWRRWRPRQRSSAKAFRWYHSDSYLRGGPWPLRSDCCPHPPVQQVGVWRHLSRLLCWLQLREPPHWLNRFLLFRTDKETDKDGFILLRDTRCINNIRNHGDEIKMIIC